MSTTDVIATDLRAVLRRLKLSPILETLPERLALARQQQIAHQDFLLLVLAVEAARRNSLATSLPVQRARLDPATQLELWDSTARLTYDQALWQELVSLRFLEQHKHLIVVGPIGVGKTFLPHALGHIACRHGYSVLAVCADKMLKTLKHARLDDSYEAELRKFLAVDLLIVDDFALDSMDVVETRDAHEIITERHREGSMIFTANRGPDEWLAMFADPMRAQSAIDRLTRNAYDLLVEGESCNLWNGPPRTHWRDNEVTSASPLTGRTPWKSKPRHRCWKDLVPSHWLQSRGQARCKAQIQSWAAHSVRCESASLTHWHGGMSGCAAPGPCIPAPWSRRKANGAQVHQAVSQIT